MPRWRGGERVERAVHAQRRWYDDAHVFERCDRGIPATFDGNIDSHWIAASDDVVACVAPDATVYWSDDAGQSWRVLATGLHAVFVERN